MIERKKKPCKGQNRAKGVPGCGKPSMNRKFGLCPVCLYEWATTNENGMVWYKKQFLPKVSKKVEKSKREKDKKIKIELTDWRRKLQSKVQEIVRLIDIGQPCLARGYHAGKNVGGHVFSRGSNPTIALNIHNIHRQGSQSNHFQNDDGLLREGLINEYGQDYFDFISELRRCKSLKYSNDEYHHFYKKASEIALKLKRDGKTFGIKDRIKKRNEINLEIGIYDKKFCVYENRR